jgi:hypothetical protein
MTEVIKWHPMETAPHDNGRILVVWNRSVEPAFWNTSESNWQEWPDGDFAVDLSDVTLWAPWPKAPKK